MPLDPEQQRHIQAAEGYIELGMFLEADAALDEIDPFVRHLPEVLNLRLIIYEKLKKWELMETVAMRLAKIEPENPLHWIKWSFAVMEAGSFESAQKIMEA